MTRAAPHAEKAHDARIDALVYALAVLLEAIEGLPNAGHGRRLTKRLRGRAGAVGRVEHPAPGGHAMTRAEAGTRDPHDLTDPEALADRRAAMFEATP